VAGTGFVVSALTSNAAPTKPATSAQPETQPASAEDVAAEIATIELAEAQWDLVPAEATTDGALVAPTEFGEVDLPAELQEPIVVATDDPASAGISLTIESDSVADSAEVASDGTVVFTTRDSVDYAVQASDDGVRILAVIEDKDAPTSFDYVVGLEDDQFIMQDESANLLIVASDGAVSGVFSAPWAVDANGVLVPTYFRVEGNQVTQVVEHLAADFAYPIVADPRWWDDILKAAKKVNQATLDAIVKAGKSLGTGAKWLAGKTWSGIKLAAPYGGKAAKFLAKKAGPGALVLCAVGAGWAWYRSDSKGWVRVGDAVSGCLL
jgi:hypothetical protein